MIRAKIKTHLFAEFSLNGAGDEGTLLDQWIQQGVYDVLLKTRFAADTRITWTFPPAVPYSDLNHSTLWVDQSTFRRSDSTGNPIGSVTVADLATVLDARLYGQTAPGGNFYMAVIGDLIEISVVPTTALYVSASGILRPSPLVDDNSDLASPTYGPIPEQWTDAVVKYVGIEVSKYDDKKAPLSPKDYQEIYRNRILEIKKESRRGMAPAGMVAGYPRGAAPRRNDTYPRY